MAWTERYVRADAAGGGDGTTDAASGASGAWTLAEGITNQAAGMKLNVRAGTYANTTTARTWSLAATTTAPCWWCGFTSTPGDLDGIPTSARVAGTDFPEFTWTTGGATISGSHLIFSNIGFTGARTAGTQVSVTGSHLRFHRCRFTNTGANAASSAVAQGGGANHYFGESYFEATGTATRILEWTRSGAVIGCYFAGGGHGIHITGGNGTLIATDNIVAGVGGDGILCAAAVSGAIVIVNNTIEATGDGIKFSTLPSTTAIVALANNVIIGAATAVNNSTGTDTNLVHRARNAFYDVATETTGFGDSDAFNDITEGADPLSGSTYTLADTADSYASAIPGLFEGPSITQTSYGDRGGVQHDDPTAGGLLIHPGMAGGLNG